MGEADVTTVKVTCVAIPPATYVVNVMVVGLAPNEDITLTLTPTGGDDEVKTFTGDITPGHDEFAFETKLAEDATYTVSVTTAPTGKSCGHLDGGGQLTMGDSDTSPEHVRIACQ